MEASGHIRLNQPKKEKEKGSVVWGNYSCVNPDVQKGNSEI